jgi:hypothetical protein
MINDEQALQIYRKYKPYWRVQGGGDLLFPVGEITAKFLDDMADEGFVVSFLNAWYESGDYYGEEIGYYWSISDVNITDSADPAREAANLAKEWIRSSLEAKHKYLTIWHDGVSSNLETRMLEELASK